MLTDIEIRWKLGRANKGSPEVPKKLQYRVELGVERTHEGFTFVERLPWSEWRDVPSQSRRWQQEVSVAKAMAAKVRVQVKDVVDYYGRTKREKAKMRRVANSIIQRCRIAYGLLRSMERSSKS